MRALVIAVVTLSALSVSLGARILVFLPIPSISRFNVASAVASELGRRGHEVVFYSTHESYPQPNVSHVRIDLDLNLSERKDDGASILHRLTSPFQLMTFMRKTANRITEASMKSSAVQQLIHSNDEFDAVIHEAFLIQEMSAVLPHRFNATSIVLMGMGDDSWANEFAGLPDNPAYAVTWWSRHTTEEATFLDRLNRMFTFTAMTLLNYYYLNRVQIAVDEYMRYPGWKTRPSLRYSFPKSPHVKEIGGVHIRPPTTLPKDIENFLNESSNGFIFFCMGTVLSTRSPIVSRIIDEMVKALTSMNQRVLCKLDNDSLIIQDNIMVKMHVPQNDVLAHKNIKLFISHGGLQSTFEALHHGVPMLLLPVFSDQYKNSRVVERDGYGIELDVSTADHSSIATAVEELLKNPKYKENAKRQSRLLKDRPMHPLNESVYWVEYVLKHGRVLQPSSVHLSFLQLHQLDMTAVLICMLIVCWWFLKWLCASMIEVFFRGKAIKPYDKNE